MIHLRGMGAALVALANPSGPARGQNAPVSLEPFQYDRRVALAVTDSLLRTDGTVAVHAIRFPSPKGGEATGLLFRPAGRGPFAGVVLQHGAPGRVDSTLRDVLRRSIEPNALAIARAGGVVIALEAPWARRLAPPVTFSSQDSVDQVHLIVDLQRAVDVLLARPDVDPERLAYVGRSYGGAIGALLAGVERRLATYVLQVGDGGLVSHFTGRGDGVPPGMPRAKWERWLQAMRPIEPIRFVGRAAPASLYFQSARKDQAVRPSDARALHAAGSEPKSVAWYDTDHALGPEATRDMLAWLHRTIGTAAP